MASKKILGPLGASQKYILDPSDKNSVIESAKGMPGKVFVFNGFSLAVVFSGELKNSQGKWDVGRYADILKPWEESPQLVYATEIHDPKYLANRLQAFKDMNAGCAVSSGCACLTLSSVCRGERLELLSDALIPWMFRMAGMEKVVGLDLNLLLSAMRYFMCQGCGEIRISREEDIFAPWRVEAIGRPEMGIALIMTMRI